MNKTIARIALLAFVLAATCTGPTRADDPSQCCPAGRGRAIHLRGLLVCLSGHQDTVPSPSVAVPTAGEAACTLGLRRGDGTVTRIVSGPRFPHPGASGVPVEVRGTLAEVDGKPVLRLDEVKAISASALGASFSAARYPMRARCAHCGCRMQVNTPSDLAKSCEVCKCSKSNEECLQY